MTMKNRRWPAWLMDLARQVWLVLQESIAGFLRNDDFRQASSLAYYTALALLPALLLLTYALSVGIASSQSALQRLTGFVADMLPRYSDVVLREVEAVYHHKQSAGLLTFFVLLWTISPLVGSLRNIVDEIFRVKPHRSPWTAKLLDLLTVTLLLLGLAAIAAAGLLLRLLKQHIPGLMVPNWIWSLLPFMATVALLLGAYAVFVPRTAWRNLLAGALATAVLWALLRPGFQILFTLNPHFGFAFGSFKSVFVIVVWIYYSQAVLLLGAEVVAALHRKDTVLIKRLMDGRRGLPALGRQRFLRRVQVGDWFFLEGEGGTEMYHVLSGTVGIRKGEREMARIGPGKFFGEMSFLLGTSRSADAVALEDCECIVVNRRNLDALMREYPDTIRDMLVEMARRLRDTSGRG